MKCAIHLVLLVPESLGKIYISYIFCNIIANAIVENLINF